MLLPRVLLHRLPGGGVVARFEALESIQPVHFVTRGLLWCQGENGRNVGELDKTESGVCPIRLWPKIKLHEKICGTAGVSHDNQRSKRAHPALQTPPKFHERTLREKRKE